MTQILAIDDGPESLPLAAEDAELDLAEADPFDAPLADSGDEPFAADPFATTIAPLGAPALRDQGREAARAPQASRSEPQASEDHWQASRSEPKASEDHWGGSRSEPQASEDQWAGEAARSVGLREEWFDEAPVLVGEPIAAGEDYDADSTLSAEPADDLDAEPWDDAPSFAAPAAAVAMDTPSGVPAMARAELRDAIEKIAWDAFGPVTEKIVREAVARIEQIAWEVVPKLAETLIQEEIRRLKGDS